MFRSEKIEMQRKHVTIINKMLHEQVPLPMYSYPIAKIPLKCLSIILFNSSKGEFFFNTSKGSHPPPACYGPARNKDQTALVHKIYSNLLTE